MLTIEIVPVPGEYRITPIRLGAIEIGAYRAHDRQWLAYAYQHAHAHRVSAVAVGRGAMPDDAVRACLAALERLRDDVTAALAPAEREAAA